MTYLHDELNRTDEETKELEQEVFLLLLHLVETIFPTAMEHLLIRETDTSVSLEHVLGDDAANTGSGVLFLLELKSRLSAFWLRLR